MRCARAACGFGLLFCALALPDHVKAAEPRNRSGIYPHLAMFNDEGECGTGAVAPWADRLWVISYAPHKPAGSTDKLYEITPGLEQIVRPESVGGTPANRMIHRESGETTNYEFPASFGAYWLRVTADADTTATAQFEYF